MESKSASLGVEQVYARYTTSENGLTEEQVVVRRAEHGTNEVQVKEVSVWQIFFSQYANFLMLLLVFGAVLSLSLGELVDGLVILGVLLVNGVLGTVQEFKAEKLTRALQNHIPQQVTVRRNGKTLVIPRAEVVVGDLVILMSGQLVPADLRIVKNFGVVVDESMLTGEAVAVVKQVEAVSASADTSNMLFGGTHVQDGGCEAVVVATGSSTEFGKIISFTKKAKKRSSFLQQVDGLSNFLFKSTLLVSGVLFVLLAVFKSDLGVSHVFLFTVALAIAIVPEMLPLISTVALTRASLKLIQSGVLIKRLSSLEDLGGVEVICTDKTGTITKNVLSVSEVVSGRPDDCVRHALYCSQYVADKDFVLAGSFDAALWKHAGRSVDPASWEQLWQGSFDPKYRWQFSVVRAGSDVVLSVKGAPESILERCNMEPAQRSELLDQVSRYGQQGMRVLAVASCPVKEAGSYAAEDLTGMRYMGLVVFEDPIKETAAPALERARTLGVLVRVLTGDAPEVALKVAREAGMHVADHEVVTGYELANLGEEERVSAIHRAQIFARVSPIDKHMIIETFAKKYSVMFLGEGINDAPALRTADVGMVVQEASDIAKETADIVLTQADLGIIIQSIYFGRQIMGNIATYMLITLTGNFGSLYAISLMSVFSPILPLLPTQVLLENILTDVPMVGLINSPISHEDQQRPSRQNIRQICWDSVYFGFGILAVQLVFYGLFHHLPVDLFRTLWLVELILFEFMLIISLRSRDWFWRAPSLKGNTLVFFVLVVMGTLLLPYLPYLSSWFHLVPYGTKYLGPILLMVGLGLVLMEGMKRVLYKKT